MRLNAPLVSLQLAAALCAAGPAAGQNAAILRPEAAAGPISRPTTVGLRAGVSPAARPAPSRPDSIETGAASIRRRLEHAAIGAAAGVVAGGAIGAGVGAIMDSHDRGDATVLASPILGVEGAAIGLVTGLVVGALIP